MLEHGAPPFLVDPASVVLTGGSRAMRQISSGRRCRAVSVAPRTARHGRAGAREPVPHGARPSPGPGAAAQAQPGPGHLRPSPLL